MEEEAIISRLPIWRYTTVTIVLVCVCAWNVYVTKYYYVYVSFGYSAVSTSAALRTFSTFHFLSLPLSALLWLISQVTTRSAEKLCWNFSCSYIRSFISLRIYMFSLKGAWTRRAREFSFVSIVSIIFLAYTHTFVSILIYFKYTKISSTDDVAAKKTDAFSMHV